MNGSGLNGPHGLNGPPVSISFVQFTAVFWCQKQGKKAKMAREIASKELCHQRATLTPLQEKGGGGGKRFGFSSENWGIEGEREGLCERRTDQNTNL